MVLLSPAGLSAQTLDDTGLWFAAFGNGELGPRGEGPSPLRWWFDAHYRMRDDADGFHQSILRPGIGVEVAEDQVLWVGYAWIRNAPVFGSEFDEHRIWQQWTSADTWGQCQVLHRSRFEQRWFETSGDMGLRWRELYRAQRVLSSSPEWSLIGWDEVFFHLNDTDGGIRSGFDQNRAFLGVGYRRSPDAPVRTEVGYLNQLVNTRGRDEMNHILSVNFFF